MFKPLGNRVLVKRWPEIEAHESGLILPALARELPQIGRVMAVGAGRWCKKTRSRNRLDIAIGDDVVFEKFAKTDYCIFIKGSEFLLLSYTALYFVIVGGVRAMDSYFRME